ncbi:adhesion G-protein coupled receptor G7-like [Perca flavescens]|uniref:adhesion G-protein coupled receptor G7-like n=1 Tax=Perca flavescens TaxID=8167 RepID=UPI00106EA8B9|nr:adhesion G-protein coupled receptor G7-like [Perca flavescens]
MVGQFNFPRTPIGWYAYSKERCPPGTSAVGKPEASTRCSKRNTPPSFQDPPHILQCGQTLTDIKQNLTSSADLETLAESAEMLTSQPEDLTAEEVTTAAQIADTLLSYENVSQSVREAAVAIVSNILNTDLPDNNQENNATLSLTQTLSRLSVDLSLISDQLDSKLVQPNIAIQSAQISAADTQGVQFTALSGMSGSFVADRILLDTNTSVETDLIADAIVHLQFTPERPLLPLAALQAAPGLRQGPVGQRQWSGATRGPDALQTKASERYVSVGLLVCFLELHFGGLERGWLLERKRFRRSPRMFLQPHNQLRCSLVLQREL